MPEESMSSVQIGFGPEDSAIAQELAEWLRNNGGTDIEVRENAPAGAGLAIIPIMIGVSIAAAALV